MQFRRQPVQLESSEPLVNLTRKKKNWRQPCQLSHQKKRKRKGLSKGGACCRFVLLFSPFPYSVSIVAVE